MSVSSDDELCADGSYGKPSETQLIIAKSINKKRSFCEEFLVSLFAKSDSSLLVGCSKRRGGKSSIKNILLRFGGRLRTHKFSRIFFERGPLVIEIVIGTQVPEPL